MKGEFSNSACHVRFNSVQDQIPTGTNIKESLTLPSAILFQSLGRKPSGRKMERWFVSTIKIICRSIGANQTTHVTIHTALSMSCNSSSTVRLQQAGPHSEHHKKRHGAYACSDGIVIKTILSSYDVAVRLKSKVNEQTRSCILHRLICTRGIIQKYKITKRVPDRTFCL